ncbi:MAG TPA: trigger factor [Clostridia bacterium]|nr:trigger factor [Clostridia bacterium]
MEPDIEDKKGTPKMPQKKSNDEFEITRLPKNAFEILVTIPWEKIKQTQTKTIVQASQAIEIKGFRKGKAPEKLVREKLGPEKLLEITLQQLLPDYYQKAVSELSLNPIMTPKVELISDKEGEAWQIKFISCEKPQLDLGNYQEELKKQKAAGEIWTPKKGEEKKEAKKPEEEREEKINQTIDWLLRNIKVGVCDLLVEEEVARKLSQLLEQTQKLGLTLDQYLASTGKTVEEIRQEYRRQVEESLALEFVLGEIAEKEKIEVKSEEIEKLIASAKTEEEKKALEGQKYYLASLLRRQKTLDFLASL